MVEIGKRSMKCVRNVYRVVVNYDLRLSSYYKLVKLAYGQRFYFFKTANKEVVEVFPVTTCAKVWMIYVSRLNVCGIKQE